MARTLIFTQYFLSFLIIFFVFPLPVAFAQQEFVITSINPEKTNLGIFHSYKYKFLLVSLISKESKDFSCLPNHYYIYNYGSEDLFELQAGNLKVNSNFSKIFFSKIHSLGGLDKAKETQWKKKVKKIIKILGSSPETMEIGKSISSDQTISCWQEPKLIDTTNKKKKGFSYLMANLCKQQWCNELYWPDQENIQFWVHIKPNKLHLIRLNTKSEAVEFKDQGPIFFKQEMLQSNAPRDNLVTSKTLKGKTLVLKTSTGKNMLFAWKMLPTGKIKVFLQRSDIDIKSAKTKQSTIANLIAQKKVMEAFVAIRFALWLDPNNQDIKFERLKAFGLSLQFDQVFRSLRDDFSTKERHKICQKLHVENIFIKQWQSDKFVKSFKKICYSS